MNAIKIKCSTGKSVLIRELLIEDQVKSAEAASARVSENSGNYPFAVAQAQEMLKMLLVQIDGKPVKNQDRDDLDSLLKFNEYNEVLSVVRKLMGDSKGEPETEIVSVDQGKSESAGG